MSDRVQREMDRWAGNAALAVVSRLATLLLIPAVLAVANLLWTHERAINQLMQDAAEKSRRIALLESQMAESLRLDARVGADLAAVLAEQQAVRRQLERIERLLERRADAGGGDIFAR